MKKIVIIGANEFQRPLVLKAKELGFETHVFAWADGAIAADDADYFYPISIMEKEAIYDICREIKPDGVLTAGSDLATVTVVYIAEKLGLPGNSTECMKVSTNKYEMRKAFENAGVPTPKYAVYSVQDKVDWSKELFPAIVKPTDRSGSRGIAKVWNEEELRVAIKAAIDNSFEKKAIVEEFIEGFEYSCECISFHGQHTMLALTKKFTTGAPHFIETGHIQPAGFDGKQKTVIQEVIFKALDALHITEGASHSEFKINENGEVRIIEIGARMGGDCIGSHLVQLSTGHDYLKMILDVAVGEFPKMNPLSKERYAAIRFVFNQEDLNVLEKIQLEHNELLVEVSPNIVIGDDTVTDSSNRFGFFIIVSAQAEDINAVFATE